MDERPIGVFDSGMGGLTVLHECLVTLPHEDFVYLGDAARLPYGPRPLAEIRRFSREIAGWLEARDVKLIRTLDAGAQVVSVACPRLVPLIESDDPFGAETVEAVRACAAPLKRAGVDTVVLGCTHYPLIRPILQRVFGREVTLVFSAEETAREVAETLARKGIENDARREGSYRFLTTGAPEAFRVMGARFLQLPIAEVEHVTVSELEAAAA